MDEIWVRASLVAGAFTVAGAFALIQRRRAFHPVRTITSTGLTAGVYFFSSATCATCQEARDKLDAYLGRGGYAERVWDQDPGSFADLGVDAVPSVLIVSEKGSGRMYSGQPDRAWFGSDRLA